MEEHSIVVKSLTKGEKSTKSNSYTMSIEEKVEHLNSTHTLGAFIENFYGVQTTNDELKMLRTSNDKLREENKKLRKEMEAHKKYFIRRAVALAKEYEGRTFR